MAKSAWMGIDVSKTHLDIFFEGTHKRFRVSDEVDACVTWVAKAEPKGVVVEATGGYEQRIVLPLQVAKQAVSVVNPCWVRDFAKSRGRLAKTDKLDAKLLAEYGEKMQPRETAPVTKSSARLRSIVTLRHQIADLRMTAKQYAEHGSTKMAARIQKIVSYLQKQVRELDAMAEKEIAKDEELAARSTRMQTVPGIGPVIAAGLLVYMPELGSLTRAQTAALAGLAPMNCESGAHRGQAHIRGGRPDVRRLLFLAAIVNCRCKSSPFKDSFRALRARGKANK
ncbi:MAG: IS110 family transposase, partial [Polyangiaceae bacterium]